MKSPPARVFAGVSILIAVVNVLAACGGGEPSPTQPAEPRATPTVSPTAAPTATVAQPSTPTPKPAAIVQQFNAFSYVQNPLSPAEWRVPPVRGGTVQIAYNSKIASRDPVGLRSVTVSLGTMMAYSRLLRGAFSDELEVLNPNVVLPVPDLAESWTASTDGRSWLLNIRKGVKWHNLLPGNPNYDERLKGLFGREFTAEDAAYASNAQITGSANQAYWNAATQAVAIDKYKLRLDLKEPFFSFVMTGPMDWQASMLPPEVKQLDGDWNKRVIGTGAFIQTAFDPGGEIRYVRNPDFWRTGLPYLDGVNISIVADPNLQRSGLFTGKFDRIFGGDIATGDELQLFKRRAADLRILSMEPHKNNFSLSFRLDKAPYNDQRFRQAFALAVNWQELIDTLYGGFGWMGPQALWTRLLDKSPSTAAEAGPYFGFDLEKAKSLVAQTGLKTPIDVPLVGYPYSGAREQQILAIKDMVAKAGINLIPNVTADLNAYYAQALTGKYEGMALQSLETGSDDDVWWNAAFASNNKFFINDPAINAMRDRQRGVADPTERRQLAVNVWGILKQQVYVLPLPEPTGWRSASPRLRNDLPVRVNGEWPHQGGQMSEIIWLSR